MSGCCVCVCLGSVFGGVLNSSCFLPAESGSEGNTEIQRYRNTEIQNYSDKPAFLVPLRILRLHRRELGELAGTQVLSPYRAFSG